jgi:hypothetical protein
VVVINTKFKSRTGGQSDSSRFRSALVENVCRHSFQKAAGLILALFPASLIAAESAPSVGPVPAPAAEERWSSFLPFLKEEAIKRGYELPLPFGVGIVYNYLQRDIEVTDVRIGVDGEPPQSVSQFLDLGSNSRVNAALVKADVWLLPFLNIYALAGYIHNESTSIGHVTVPLPPPLPRREFDIRIPTEIEGLVGGLGVTMAAGYKSFFLAADANYSQTDLGFDDSFRAVVASVRTGWNGKFGDVPTRLWVGGAYWDTANTASSTVDVAGVGRVSFEADQGPRNAWNAVIGGSVVFGRHWDCFAEYGFNLDDVHIVAAGVTYRF